MYQKIRIKTPVIICAAACVLITNTGCVNSKRALCVGAAAIDYHDTISLCIDEGIETYDECDQKYDIEKTFEDKQKECR